MSQQIYRYVKHDLTMSCQLYCAYNGSLIIIITLTLTLTLNLTLTLIVIVCAAQWPILQIAVDGTEHVYLEIYANDVLILVLYMVTE